MKKYAFSLVLGLATMMFAYNANAQIFHKGSNVVNAGVGFGGTFYTGSTSMPFINASYERGIADGKFGVGGFIGYTSSGGTYWKWSYTVIGARGDYHFYMTDKLDTYGGLMLAYKVVSSKYTGPSGTPFGHKASAGGLGVGLFVGGRYYFSDNIGAFAELGFGASILNIGLAFKF